MTEAAIIPVPLPDKQKHLWLSTAEAYVVDELSCGLLLGLHFLKTNRLHIQWGHEGQNDTIRVADTKRELWAICLRNAVSSRGTAHIRATREVVVLPVSHRSLPVAADEYIVTPQVVHDPRHLAYGSLPNAFIDGQTFVLPFSSFGDVPITVRKGQLLGTLRRVEITDDVESFITQKPGQALKAVPLPSLLGDVPPNERQRYPDGYAHRIKVIHRSGKSHVNVDADAQSRQPKSEAPPPDSTLTEPIVRTYGITRQQVRLISRSEGHNKYHTPRKNTSHPDVPDSVVEPPVCQRIPGQNRREPWIQVLISPTRKPAARSRPRTWK
ncbi:hypothetical protein VPNG_06290 [Cytospora leucostoma]|uniref:Uncharacterized protein n=1 Tax=Cytospora leucostoma TaxID=1230097 RepID=A0A423X2L3_9PEZI|nr:hypothetical protein VPNG_06290 [Cytospora leucostoma]